MKKLLLVICLLLISFPIVLPFFHNGYFPTHDGEWAVVRLAEMHREIKDLQIPPRWSGYLNHGFGYPLFLFNYPLPYYVGEIFNLLGFGLVGSIKIIFILSVILSGLTMFLLGHKLWGKFGGLVSAIFYLYLPFRFVDLYVRGSIGEALAFIFYPLIFWLGINLLEKKTKLWVIATAISLAALILTHNIMAILFLPFWLIFIVLFSFKEKSFLSAIRYSEKSFAYSLSAAFLGLSLSAFFWLPALVEKQYVIVGHIPIANLWQNFVSIKQLILPSWGYGLPGQVNAFSFQIGWVHLLGFILCLFFLRKQKFIFLFLILAVFISCILMLPISYLFWHYTPLFSTIDFPWRILGILGFFVCFGIGGLVNSSIGKKIAVVLSVLVIIINFGYAKPAIYLDKGDGYYATNDATTTSFDELMPVWVKIKPTDRLDRAIFNYSNNIKNINLIKETSQKLTLDLILKTDEEIYFNKIYFPNWGAKIDNQEATINYQNDRGLISLAIPAGQHKIELSIHKTPVEGMGDIISIVSLIIILILLLRKNK